MFTLVFHLIGSSLTYGGMSGGDVSEIRIELRNPDGQISMGAPGEPEIIIPSRSVIYMSIRAE